MLSLKIGKIMTDNIDNSDVENVSDKQDDNSVNPNRRRMLIMGAVATSAVVTVRPAIAQTSGSVLNCEIPVAGSHGYGKNIAPDGTLVAPETEGSFQHSGRRYKAKDIQHALRGRTLPGTNSDQSRAYVNYIRRLRSGQSGFTCFASLQYSR